MNTVTTPQPQVLDFDPAALREKYRIERERRLRPDGNDQYIDVSTDPTYYLTDPLADSDFARPPVIRDAEVVILGGGFGGLLIASRLKEAGISDVVVLEKAADFGGTWYWNRYPGAACDTESYIYLPLLEETGYIPTSKYALGPEIWEHARRIGRHFDLYEAALFQTTCKSLKWQEHLSRWLVKTDRGDRIQARFVAIAGGILHVPKLPGIPGVRDFKGHTFHTTRWDYAYTGGDPNGDLTGLKDKRVGIIGTGATAVQCVPHLGRSAKELFVFQRTPSSVDARNDQPTDPEWVASLQPGWQRERVDNFTTVVSGGRFDKDLVNDGWTDLIGNIILAARRANREDLPKDPQELVQQADYQKMERVRARIDAVVKDRATAEALKPWYNQFCKRPCFHDEYLDTFNRPNVHLVDTGGKGVDRITENGVVVAGREYELDCLIYATGFEGSAQITRHLGCEIIGRDGQTLGDKWQNGIETLHGIFTSGFPNLLLNSHIQSGQSPNFAHMLNERARHIAYVVSEAERRQARTVEATPEGEAEWVSLVVKHGGIKRAFLEECTPGYYNNEGQLDKRAAQNSVFWRGPVIFLKILKEWRESGTLTGLELRP
jgi:cyclohexanone monooxygenase